MEPSLLDVYQALAEQVAGQFNTAGRGVTLPAGNEAEFVSSLVQLFVDSTLEFTYLSENFVQRYPEEEHDLEAGYRGSLQQLRGVASWERGELAVETGFAHAPQEDSFNFFAPETIEDKFENLVLQRALRDTFAPSFQLSLMEIDPNHLQQPVLDLGCGQTGKLVAYLRNLGNTAYGVDQLAESFPYLTRLDWLAMDLQPNTWGTIISHMGFSSQFTFHHHYTNGNPEAHARLFSRILNALKPLGQFIYLPGLPFIEQFLPPEQYRIARRELIQPQGSEAEFSGLPRSEIWYVSKITRL